MSTFTSIKLDTFLKENTAGKLCKIYKTYSGSLLQAEYKTNSERDVGGECLKTTYIYAGTRIIGQDCSVDTWTQLMEDTANGTALERPSASISFDGTNDSILWGTGVYNFAFDQSFSISAWVKFGTLTNQQGIISCSGTNQGWQILKTNTTNFIRFRLCHTATTNDLQITGNVAMAVNTWYHIVITKAGSTAALTKIYVNGVLNTNTVNADLSTTTPVYTTYTMQFGAKGGGDFFAGLLDNVLFSNSVLTQDEVTELYNQGVALMPGDFSGYASVASAWKLGESTDTTGTNGILDQKGLYPGTMTNMLLTNIVGNYPGE